VEQELGLGLQVGELHAPPSNVTETGGTGWQSGSAEPVAWKMQDPASHMVALQMLEVQSAALMHIVLPHVTTPLTGTL